MILNNFIITNIFTMNQYLALAKNIKNINKDEITVGIRDLLDKYEYWIICKKKKYDMLDTVYDLYTEMSCLLSKPISFVFVEEQQFIGKDNIVFLIKI